MERTIHSTRPSNIESLKRTPKHLKIVGHDFRCRKLTSKKIVKEIRNVLESTQLARLLHEKQIELAADIGVFFKTLTVSLYFDNESMPKHCSVRVSFYPCE